MSESKGTVLDVYDALYAGLDAVVNYNIADMNFKIKRLEDGAVLGIMASMNRDTLLQRFLWCA